MSTKFFFICLNPVSLLHSERGSLKEVDILLKIKLKFPAHVCSEQQNVSVEMFIVEMSITNDVISKGAGTSWGTMLLIVGVLIVDAAYHTNSNPRHFISRIGKEVR